MVAVVSISAVLVPLLVLVPLPLPLPVLLMRSGLRRKVRSDHVSRGLTQTTPTTISPTPPHPTTATATVTSHHLRRPPATSSTYWTLSTYPPSPPHNLRALSIINLNIITSTLLTAIIYNSPLNRHRLRHRRRHQHVLEKK